MIRLFAEKFFSLIFILIGMAVITFFLIRVIPADPAAVAAGIDARPEQVEAMRKQLGLDRPLLVQFWDYMKGLMRGDLGRSIRTRRPVLEDLKIYFPATLELALSSVIAIVFFGIPLGVIAAVNFNRWPDYAIRLFVAIAMGVPAFALGLALQLVFAKGLGWLPLEGRLDVLVAPPPHVTGMYTVDSFLARDWTTFWSSLRHLVLPVTALASGRLAVGCRFTRNSLLEVFDLQYISTARAKGLRERMVVLRHALRNALIPVVTVLGVQFGFVLGGAVLVETVFTWPGLGRYAFTSIIDFDFYSVIAVTLVVSILFVLSSTIVDILYNWIDPRVKLQ